MRRLRVRTAAHLRVSTSANVVSSFYKRGACWRDSTDARVRMATTGAWSLSYLALARHSLEMPSPSSALLHTHAGTTLIKHTIISLCGWEPTLWPFGVSRPEGRVNG